VIAGSTSVPTGPQSVTFAERVGRLNPDGTPDTSFGPNGFRTLNSGSDDGTKGGSANAVAVQPDGRVLVVGTGPQS
jgi:hypothetical protein